MDENTIILRPISDYSRNCGKGDHIPDSDSPAYILVNEEEADNDASYIFLAGGIGINGSDGDAEYVFNLDVPKIPTKKKIKNILFHLVCMGDGDGNGSIIPGLLINNTQYRGSSVNYRVYYPDENDMTNEYKMYSSGLSESEIEIINNTFDAVITQLCLSVDLSVSVAPEYKREGSLYLTQVYLEIALEDEKNIGVFYKINGTYKAATTAYKKINGAWTEISEDECKEILKNNNIRRG